MARGSRVRPACMVSNSHSFNITQGDMFPQAGWQGFQHALPAFAFGLVFLAHEREYTVQAGEVFRICC